MTRLSRRLPLAAPLVLGALLLLVLGAPLAAAPAARAASPTEPVEPRTAYVDVSVATLWVEPGRQRPVDLPSMTNPADPRAWTAGMTLAERRWLIGDLETQATYGQRVLILAESGDWAQVVVPGQPTPRHEWGYPGWLPKVQLTDGRSFGHLAGRPFALVATPTAWLYDDPRRTRRAMELSYNTRLPVLARLDRAVLVATPSDGPKWLAASDVSVYASAADIPRPTGPELVAASRMFLGLPYLWAGTAGFGFDCSGLTHSVYAAHGITIPRDAQDQANAGTPVTREQLAPGDLVFFARNNGTGRVHHVGMYAGDGYIVDAPTNTDTEESGVEYVRLDEHRYAHEYAGARRYL
ncbi:C40 family peptidase [Plantactinospora sp. BC1]|uniref:C40 family peptidase n=1 Tax=Plantactinospora sp. BC1 TaxID=2108470 RepID=UPI0018FE1559|nr:C40 family peptidase [Plantactinospora sp. BC1]